MALLRLLDPLMAVLALVELGLTQLEGVGSFTPKRRERTDSLATRG